MSSYLDLCEQPHVTGIRAGSGTGLLVVTIPREGYPSLVFSHICYLCQGNSIATVSVWFYFINGKTCISLSVSSVVMFSRVKNQKRSRYAAIVNDTGVEGSEYHLARSLVSSDCEVGFA